MVEIVRERERAARMISNGMSLLERISSPSSPSHSPPLPPPPPPQPTSSSLNHHHHQHQHHLDTDAGKFIKPNFSSILLSSSSSSSSLPSSFGVEALSHVSMSAQNAIANNFLNSFRAAQHASIDPTFGQCFQLLLQTQQQQQQQTLNGNCFLNV